MKPPFAYYGGKVGMAPLIVSLLPEHRVYIEPFFGCGAVLFAKEPSTHEIVNDLDDGVATFFRMLRDRPEDLERVCALTPYSRSEYMAARADYSADELERARQFWVRVNQSFGKTAGHATGWSVSTARTQSTANSVVGRIDRFADATKRLRRVVIEHCDAADLIDRLAKSADTVVYADPPYLASTRNGRKGRAAAEDYAHDMGTEADHERLAEALHRTPAKVVLSGYPSPLYEALYRDWRRIDVPVLVHSSNAVTNARAQRVECLWLNYDPPADNGQIPMDLEAAG